VRAACSPSEIAQLYTALPYIVWWRVWTHGHRSGTKEEYAMVPFGILDIDFREFIFYEFRP
jgi:hypothetical protein